MKTGTCEDCNATGIAVVQGKLVEHRLLRVESVTVRQLGLGREQQRLVCVELGRVHHVRIRRSIAVKP